MYVSGLRGIATVRGTRWRAAALAAALAERSEGFRALWDEHQVGILPKEVKRYVHPSVGLLELNCQVLNDPHQSHSLLVHTAAPGSESYEKLRLLEVVQPAT